MDATSSELIQARQAAEGVLEDLGLQAFMFEVEPDGVQWLVDVECAATEGWTSLSLRVNKEQLLAARSDVNLRNRLAGEWRDRLRECRQTR